MIRSAPIPPPPAASAAVPAVAAAMPAPAGRLDHVLRGAVWTLGASGASVLIGLLQSVVLIRLLGPECKGRIDLVTATVTLSASLFGFSLANGIIYVGSRQRSGARRLAGLLAALAVGQGLAGYAAMRLVVGSRWESAFLPAEYAAWIPAVVGLAVFALQLTSYWRSFLIAQQRFSTAARLDVANRVLIAAAMLLAAWWLHADRSAAAAAAVVAMVGAWLASALVVPAILLRHMPGAGQPSRFGEVWRYSMPCFFGNLVQFLNYRLDVFLVAYYAGTRELALYLVAVSMGQLLWLPAQSLQEVLFPGLSAMTDPDARARAAAQLTRLLLTATLLAAALMALAGPWLIVFLFGAQCAPSSVALWLLLPGIAVFSVAMTTSIFVKAIGRPSVNLAIAVVALAVTVVVNVLLTPTLGMRGAAIASSLSYATTALLTLWFFCVRSGYGPAEALLPRWSDRRLLVEWLKTR